MRALERLLTSEQPAWPLALCRIGTGMAAAIRGAKTVRDMYLLQHDPATVPARLFDWAPSMSATWEIVGFGLVWMAAAGGLMLGYQARLSAATLLALSVFQHLVDQNYWAHHMYFLMLMLLLLALSESDATLSARWSREGFQDRWVARWPVWLLKVQLSIAYFYSAAAKLNEAFLGGQVFLDRLALPDFARHPSIVQALSTGAVGLEFFLAFALWHRTFRPYALAVGLLFHGIIPVTMGLYAGLLAFSIMVLSVYVLFLDDRTRPMQPARL